MVKAPALPRVPWWLTQLAERKLGKSATVKARDDEWVAELEAHGTRSRVTANNRDTLVWFLEQMPDKETP